MSYVAFIFFLLLCLSLADALDVKHIVSNTALLNLMCGIVGSSGLDLRCTRITVVILLRDKVGVFHLTSPLLVELQPFSEDRRWDAQLDSEFVSAVGIEPVSPVLSDFFRVGVVNVLECVC